MYTSHKKYNERQTVQSEKDLKDDNIANAQNIKEISNKTKENIKDEAPKNTGYTQSVKMKDNIINKEILLAIFRLNLSHPNKTPAKTKPKNAKAIPQRMNS